MIDACHWNLESPTSMDEGDVHVVSQFQNLGILQHIPGTLNPSDDLTKPLGWVLHSYHACCLMGHFKPSVLSSQSALPLLQLSDPLPSPVVHQGRVSASAGHRTDIQT